jgi:hypothetical protein
MATMERGQLQTLCMIGLARYNIAANYKQEIFCKAYVNESRSLSILQA